MFYKQMAVILIDKNDTKVFLKGVAFGNDFWFNTPSKTHHNEIDF